MGECYYRFKARFPKGTLLDKKKEIEAFIDEGVAAEDWWQDHRNNKPSVFWPQFKKLFPTITEYLDTQYGWEELDKNCGNGLAGILEFGKDRDSSSNLQTSYDDALENDILLYTEEVWHLAEWNGFCEFLKHKWGALDAVWNSEEAEPDWPNFYDADEIVHKIFKSHDPALLIGIDPQLDILLEEKIKRQK